MERRVSLDDAFGLSPGKWSKREVESHRGWLTYNIYLLTEGLKISLAHGKEAFLWYHCRKLTRDKYSREWKRKYLLEDEEPFPLAIRATPVHDQNITCMPIGVRFFSPFHQMLANFSQQK